MRETLESVVPRAASWVFSPAFLWHALDGRHKKLLRDLGVTAVLDRSTTLAQMYDLVYAEMLRSYRSEYVYKNELIRRIFETRHDPDTAALLLEKQIANRESRVDVLVVNDTTTAYEVKSDLDSLVRVEQQTAFALRTFDRVVVACAGDFVSAVREKVDERVGIIRLDGAGEFVTEREARENAASVEPDAIFSVLHQAEYITAIEDRFGSLPQLNAYERYDFCRERFARLTPQASHDVLLAALRKRFVRSGNHTALKGAAHALAHLYYKMTPKERIRLFVPRLLEKTIG